MDTLRFFGLVLYKVFKELNKMTQALVDLTAAVAAEKTVTQSAITLLVEIKSQLDALIAAGNQDPALAALTADLGANTAALAAAVSANTPVAPPTDAPVVPPAA